MAGMSDPLGKGSSVITKKFEFSFWKGRFPNDKAEQI